MILRAVIALSISAMMAAGAILVTRTKIAAVSVETSAQEATDKPAQSNEPVPKLIEIRLPKPIASTPATPLEFGNAQTAQLHCPKDSVVWANMRSKAYYGKGDKYYAKTKKGSFVCEHEALRSGFHSSGLLPAKRPPVEREAEPSGPGGGDKGLEFRLRNN